MSNLSDLLPAGGGQNAEKLVATGTLASGKPVILNADGTVTQVVQSAISAALGTAVAYNDGTDSCAIAYDSINNKILIAYKNGGNNAGECIVGTISGTTLSFGTAVQFAGTINGDFTRKIGICFNSTEGKFVIVYRDSNINNSGRAITATISGTSVSFGSSAVFTSDVTNSQACSFDSASNKVVIVYTNDSDGNDGYGVVATLSGTSLSFGTPVEFNQYNTSFPTPIYDSNANKTVIVYRDQGVSNLYKGMAIVATVSGTSISYGSAVTFNAASTEMQSGSFDSVNNKIVVCYANSGNSGYGTAIVGTVSGTSISFGTAAVFQSSTTALTQFMPAYNVAAGKTVIGYAAYNGSAWLGTYVEATVSGTSVSFNTPAVLDTDSINYTPAFAAYDSTANVVVFPYRDSGNANYGTAIAYRSAYTDTNLTATNFIGISAEDISNGATGSVNLLGGINEAQSGLTIASDYYVQDDGSLNTATSAVNYDIANASYTQAFSVASQETFPSGIAFNTDGTKMFITGNTGNDINEYTLSTAYDVSSAVFVDSFDVSAKQAAVMGVAFNTDGTKMFIVGETEDTVAQYALSTGFDVSTASFTQTFSIASQETEAQSLTFNTDGTKMFIVGDTGNDISEYTLSSGFDVSTASFVDSFSLASQTTQPKEGVFNTDGTELYVLARDPQKVYKYTLSTGFDVSTASYASVEFSVAGEETSPQGLAFSADGSKMYVCGDTGDDINQYATTSTATNSTTVLAGQAISATTINMRNLT